MREAVCLVSLYIFVNTVEAVKPKSVNLALETVLQFEKKDHSADVEVLDRVQSFLNNIKNVMASSKKARRRSYDNDLKFTDFLLEATEILKKYDDNDLEHFFTVLDDQSRKYNYKGCKFFELVDNNDVRRFMSSKLEQAKDTSAKTMRRYLSDVAKVISSDQFDDRHRGFVNFVNSLYDGASDKLRKVVKSLRSYPARKEDSALNLDVIVSNALRTLVFDHYSNLNDIARQQLKTAVGNYWLNSKYNGANYKKEDRYRHGNDDMEEVQDYKSKLRVIDVPSKFSKNNGDRLNIESLKGSKSTSSYKKVKRHKTKIMTSKLDKDFINFKKTTREQPAKISDEDNTKRNEKQYAVTQGLIDEDVSNSYEVKKPKTLEKEYKTILPTKASSDDKSDNDKSSSEEYKDKKGASIKFANEKYIIKQKKTHKKQKIGHITYDVDRRQKFKAHDYTDEDGTDIASVIDENAGSRPEQEDSSEDGVLIGGQNIHNMRFRVEPHTPKPSKKKVKDLVEDISAVSVLQKSTKKLRDRQKSKRKSSKKTTEKKTTLTHPTTTPPEKQSTTNDIHTEDTKDLAFRSSDEGITIETFENEKEIENVKKNSNLRKALPHTIGVHKRIDNLEKQLEDVKQKMKLVIQKVNHTEEDPQTNSEDVKSESKISNTEKKVQINTNANVSNQNDKVYEMRAYSRDPNNTDAETTKIKPTEHEINYTTTIVQSTIDKEIKPNRTKTWETSESTKEPIFRFRSEVEETDNKNSQTDNVIISTLKENKLTESVKDYKTTKVDVLYEITSMNTKTDSIFKTSEEKSATSVRFEDVKNDKENTSSTMITEEIKTKTIMDKKEEDINEQMKTTTIDLTKHLKDSNTVVVTMKDETEKNIEEIKESTRNLSDEMDLPQPPSFNGGKLEDPFNDIDLDLM